MISYEVQIFNFRDFVRGIIFRQHLVRIANSILLLRMLCRNLHDTQKSRNISKCVYAIHCNFPFDLVICTILHCRISAVHIFYWRFTIERNVLSIGGIALGKVSGKIWESSRKLFGGFFWTTWESSRKYHKKIFWKLSRVCSIRSNWIPLTHIALLYKHTVPFNHIDTFFT